MPDRDPASAARTRTSSHRVAAVAVAAVLALLLVPAVAHAGTYKIYACQDPAGALASTASWSFDMSDPGTASHDDSCPRGGVHVRLKAGVSHPADAEARAFFYAPSGTVVVSYTLWRSARVAAGTPYFFSAMERFGTDWRWAGTGCKGTDDCSGIGNPSSPLSSANKFSRKPPTPITGIALYLSCGNDNGGSTDCPASSGTAADAWLHRADITLADDVAPALETDPTGALVNTAAPVSGVAPVSLLASDQGGGLTHAQVEIDGNIMATQALGGQAACREPYTARVPCPLQASTTIPVDTSTLADGTHSVRVLVSDVGGNVKSWGPVAITTANPQRCSTEPAATSDIKLKAGVVRPRRSAGPKRKRRAQLTIPYAMRKRVRFTGRLVAPDGSPIAGAAICVVSRPQGLAVPPQTLGQLTTNANGRFALPVPRGSSRELYAIYRTGGAAVTARAVVRVVPRLTVRPSARSLANGQVLTLRGRLAGGPIPSRGVLVRAEAWRGTHWQPFGETRAKGPRGRFRLRYRFVGTTGVQRYALRVRVVKQAAYPYLGAKSRRIHVRVHG